MTETTVKSKNYIMVVEDDEFYVKIFQSKIAEAGIPVVTFTSAEEALKYAQKKHPKLIIADLIMPRLDGFKFIELIRGVPGLKKIPIMVFSNLAQGKDIAEAKKLGADDYIVKTDISLTDAMTKIKSWYSLSKN